MIELKQGDCLEVIDTLPNNKYQLIYFNPPFKFFEAKWDSKHLDYHKLWDKMWDKLTNNGTIVIHSSQKFTYYLINTQPKYFKYFYIWNRNNKSNFLHCKIQPLRQTEEICVFYKRQCKYNPQMTKRDKPIIRSSGNSTLYTRMKATKPIKYTHKYPTNLLEFPIKKRGKCNRPEELCDFIIKTYTDENDNVLDLTMADGITGKCCKKLNRNYVGIELDKEQFEKTKLDFNAKV